MLTPSRTEVVDVLVIGSGGAGLRAALELKKENAHVVVVGKCKKREAHTWMAQGGINAALRTMDPEDNWEIHAADTIHDGGEINDTLAVETLCQNAAAAIHELDEWGCPFHKDENGKIVQRFFGAASYRRACFVGSSTGTAILNTLVDQAEKAKIPFFSEVYIFALLQNGKRVNGALGLNMNSGEIIAFQSKAVILATGGHSRMYKRSSSHFWENNGDGVALAYRLGASFVDMEMFQFHPTGMVFPEEAEGLLISEATRGEGGILTNALGERFMEKYAPERLELSARDVVARANYMEIAAGRGTEHGGVYLDISHKPADYIMERLPTIYEQYLLYTGKNITKEKMEVGPTAHYSMGGILANYATGETGIENLFAVGEVVGGVHGGNRLGGNSLAEILVFGKLVGAFVAKDLEKRELLPLDQSGLEKELATMESLLQNSNGEDPIALKKSVQKIMNEYAGVVREAPGLQKAQSELAGIQGKKVVVGSELKNNEKLIAALDLAYMFPICSMILASALERTESRAAHFRSDYPERNDATWKKNIICTPEADGTLRLSTRPVATPSTGVLKAMQARGEVSKELLE